ncbi:MAG: RNA polymerase factor sigma-54 [Kiritimatiellae bacterium]|nr:RNA polymerase factor sigma-54 [Kiritimatiellia bacterium]
MSDPSQPLLTQTQDQRLQQVLAPQLRQSLEVLQAPVLELQTLIRQHLEQNPALEEKLEPHETIELEAPPVPAAEELSEEELQRWIAYDEAWRERYQRSRTLGGAPAEEEERHQRLLESLSRPESLQDHLLRQIEFSEASREEREIARLLIGSLNDDGYLNVTLGELSETTGIPVEKFEAALRLVQDLEPAGIGARDLKECLRLQLARRGLADSLAARIVEAHLEDLAKQRHFGIARALGVPVSAVYAAAKVIQSLDPKPGRDFGAELPVEVVPDAAIVKTDNGYSVVLNRERLPRVKINREYLKLLDDPSTSPETREYVREKVRAGLALIRSLHQRQSTLGAIVQEIAEQQREFFERGPEALRPMTMAQLAQKIGVHETTVSRAVAGKFVETPRGVFPLRYFFSTGYQAADGRDVAATSVKDAIRAMIEEEDPAAPLSDEAIARRLGERGLRIARRTVAKYREQMGIPPSHERRA